MPITWTIAGSDCSGGAGIQADIKTMNALGTHACSIITAITAQNTGGVSATQAVSAKMLEAQLAALQTDMSPKALKLGMLANAHVVQAVAQGLAQIYDQLCPKPVIVCDPVCASSSGAILLEPDARDVFLRALLPHITLLTPNWAEAAWLSGQPVNTPKQAETAAHQLLAQTGIQAVLVTGGEETRSENAYAQDYYADRQQTFWLKSPWQNTRNTHGTGCTLSAAITAFCAHGLCLPEAVIQAKTYVNQGLRLAPAELLKTPEAKGPLAHLCWPEHLQPEDLPVLSPDLEQLTEHAPFATCGPEPLGFYPIIDRAAWLEKLLPLGVRTIQLRIKDLNGATLTAEIAEACRLASLFQGTRLFVNDYWQTALACKAYGVHLGQEDLKTLHPDDLTAMRQAGLRLGLSTHSFSEVARAMAVKPSYIAIGPVFETTTKRMAFTPQGLEGLRLWRRLLPDVQLVAIAGIFLESNAQAVLETGVESVAVVRDITQCAPEQLPDRVQAWQKLFASQKALDRFQISTG